MKYRSICVVLTAILLAPGLLAQDWKAQEYTMEPGNLGTPTTRWLGQQYSSGKISVLILKGDQLGYRQNTRQPMELLRAFPFMDIEYSLYGYHMSDNERTLKLLESRKWDVIVSWDHWRAPWPKLSNEAKFRVLSTVADGTGILFVRRPPRNVLRKDRQIETPVNDIAGGLGLTGRAGRTEKYFNRLPREEAAFKKAFATAYKVGKGRALVFSRFKIEDNSGAKLFRWDHSIDHQYMMAEMGRAILWAAQKEPRVKFVSTPPALRKLAWGKTKGQTGKWILDAGKNPLGLTIEWRVRDLKDHVLARDERKFEGAKDKITCQFTLPDLDAGRYYTDLLIKSARGGENYGYAGLHVPAPCEVELNQKQKGVEPDGKLAGTALFTLQEEQEIPKPALLLEVLDNHDRIVVRRRVDAEPGQKVPYAFSIDPHYPIQMRVRARVVAGKREAGSAWLTYHILRRRHDRFNMVLWGSWNGPYRHWGKLKLRETGVTSSLSGKSEVANINRTPTNFAYNWPVGEKKMRSPRPKKDPELGVPVMQPACWNEEEAFQKMLSAKDGVFESGTRTPVFVYNMYDEGPHSGMCLHPECLKAYRSWLKEFYGDELDALNREWESDYKSWDQVNVMKKGDNHEKAAREAGIYARWSDRKHFGEVNFCRRMIGGLTERARKYDPKALVGFEGSGGFGMDFDELISNSGFWCPYDGIRTEVVRSLKPEGFIHSFWIGYNKKGDRLIARAWRAVINDAPSIWWWMLAGRGRFHGWLAPNNEPYPENRRFLDEVIIPLRRGLGDLLMQLDQKHDGIALYYSVAASHAGELTEAAAFNSVKGAHGSILRLIEDCGYQWVYTTRKRTLEGDLKERGIKLLILPFIQTLGQKEVDTLRKFVKNGGTVLADLRPGVYSGHCRPLEHGPADALFGVRRTGEGKAVRIDGELQAKLKGKTISIRLNNNRADAQLTVDGGTAAGKMKGCPVFVANKIGDGRAILLNFHLTQYNAERLLSEGKAQREFFRQLADAIGLKPKLERNDGEGSELLRAETATWKGGNVTVYGLYRDGGKEGPARVVLPSEQWIFDLRRGKVGKTTTVDIPRLKPGYAEFLTTYPYDPGQPKVEPSRETVHGGETVTFRISMSGVPAREKGPFSFSTRLLNPEGEWVEVIPWSAQGRGGKARTSMRFAHNDPAGKWTLKAREVTTGRTAECVVIKK